MNSQGRRNPYHDEVIRGNTVRKLEPAPLPIRERPNPNVDALRRKNRRRSRSMNFINVLFLVSALVVSSFVLTMYIGLQSDITNTVRNVARLERELNNLRLINEENLSRIVNDVDLEYIRRVAIQELGMIYAVEGQIIMFDDSHRDYVRQINTLH
ncbi:MAG: cell division protein FtsL [Lachnospiraceae bacterium]|jgi:hypothetical protein|nr:cell division protein FtsL [Lachnospiraceae bacterium]